MSGSASRVARWCVLLSALAASSASAQVSGTVTDAATGEALIGATVRVAGTTLGAATDLDGRYRIPTAPRGAAVLVASYIGYESDSVSVSVPAGGLVQDFALALVSVQGQEAVVTAQGEGQLAAINQQLSSNTIVNVVSAARLQELPDANAAEAIGRLSGIATVRSGGEANQIAVRGLGPAYTSVTVNGISLPSTNDNRSTDLNSISPELLEGVEVYKALRPDLDADAIGGLVNFQLRDAPRGFRFNPRVQTGYNGLSGEFGQYKSTLGLSNRFLSERLGVILQGSAERANRAGISLDPFWSTDRGTRTEYLTVGRVNVSRRDDQLNRYGATLLLDYRLPGGKVQLATFASSLSTEGSTYATNYDLTAGSINYNTNEREGRTSLLSTSLRGDHRLPFGADVAWALSRGVAIERVPETNSFSFQQGGAYTRSLRDSLRVLDNGFEAFVRNQPENVVLLDSDVDSSRKRERDLIGKLDLRVPFSVASQFNGYFKVGGKIRQKDRFSDVNASEIKFTNTYGRDSLRVRFPERTFLLNRNGSYSIANWLPDETRGGSEPFDSGVYSLGYVPDLAGLREVRDRLGDVYRQSFERNLDDYSTDERVSAAYGMTELNAGPLLVVGGLRYEYTRSVYNAVNGIVTNSFDQTGTARDTTSGTSYGDWLPNVQVRYKPVGWFDVRLARTESILRPSHFQASPRLRANGTTATLNRGNTALKPTRGTSYDLFLSFSSNNLGLLTAGAFVKTLDDVIYSRSNFTLLPADLVREGLPPEFRGYRLTDYANLPEPTTVRGLELEWQTRFTYLPGPLSGLLLTANVSRMFSKTRYPVTELRRETTEEFPFTRLVNVDTTYTERVPTQSDWLANVGLGYDLGGFSGRVSMLYQGTRLASFSPDPFAVNNTGDYLRFDVRLRQRLDRVLGGRSLGLFLNLNNLTDASETQFQSQYILLGDEDHFGRSVDLGLTLAF